MDDELLGRKPTYGNSSDDEEPKEDVPDGIEGEDGSVPDYPYNSTGAQTGPKGVLNDYRRYKQLEREQRIIDEQRKIQYIKNTAITCTSEKQDTKELEELDENFLQDYHQKRLQQLKADSEKYVLGTRPKFGEVFQLDTTNFIESVDNVDAHVTVIIHIYENTSICVQMNKCFDSLAKQYQYVKFCRIQASEAGLSSAFTLKAVPTIQVYKNGILIENHIRMGDYLEDEFYAADVEAFLIEHDALPSQQFNAANPVVVVANDEDFYDSDFELD